VLAAGIFMVLVGFVLIVPRGAMAGSAAHRNVSLGSQRVFQTPGYRGEMSTRYKVIRVSIGIVLLIAGVVFIATSG
jgi:hypothetical protein